MSAPRTPSPSLVAHMEYARMLEELLALTSWSSELQLIAWERHRMEDEFWEDLGWLRDRERDIRHPSQAEPPLPWHDPMMDGFDPG